MEKLRVLVTGATGFVGSHVIESLNDNENVHIIAACRNPSRLLPGFKGEVRQGDLNDSVYIREVVKDIDVVCHAAAWTSLWNHRKEEERFFKEPTIALINASIEIGVQRFIFDSSVVVTKPGRNGKAISDHEPTNHPQFWPHVDMVVDIENHMRESAGHGTAMVSLRCGHFAGARYNLGLLSLLIPRLKTHLVPWVSGGKTRVPLVDGRDIGQAYALASMKKLEGFESFNICGTSFPTMREVIEFLHDEIKTPRPHFSVPLTGAYLFGWLMEKLNPVLPGEPFLTRSIVFLGEDWYAPSNLAGQRLGYEPKYDWKETVRSQLKEMEQQGYPKTSLVDGTRWWARR